MLKSWSFIYSLDGRAFGTPARTPVPVKDLFVDRSDTSQTEVQQVQQGGRDHLLMQARFHRLDTEYGLLRDFCKILWYAVPGKILGLEQKFPFFHDLSQDLLP